MLKYYINYMITSNFVHFPFRTYVISYPKLPFRTQHSPFRTQDKNYSVPTIKTISYHMGRTHLPFRTSWTQCMSTISYHLFVKVYISQDKNHFEMILFRYN